MSHLSHHRLDTPSRSKSTCGPGVAYLTEGPGTPPSVVGDTNNSLGEIYGRKHDFCARGLDFPWTREEVVGRVEDGLGGRKYDLEDCLGRKLGGLEIDMDLALLVLGLNRSRSNRNSTHMVNSMLRTLHSLPSFFYI